MGRDQEIEKLGELLKKVQAEMTAGNINPQDYSRLHNAYSSLVTADLTPVSRRKVSDAATYVSAIARADLRYDRNPAMRDLLVTSATQLQTIVDLV